MRSGYIGQRSRKRRRNILLLLFFIFLFGLIIFSVSSFDVIDDEMVAMENINDETENTILINKLENKLLEIEQKLFLRENLLNSLNEKNKILENNNKEYIAIIQLLNIEEDQKNIESKKSNRSNRLEIQKLQKTIDQLKDEIKLANYSYLSIKKNNDTIKKKNDAIQNQINIIENNNNTLIMQKNIAFKKIDELNNIIIEKEKLIKEMKDKIHH